jgi:hypothetical protein
MMKGAVVPVSASDWSRAYMRQGRGGDVKETRILACHVWDSARLNSRHVRHIQHKGDVRVWDDVAGMRPRLMDVYQRAPTWQTMIEA